MRNLAGIAGFATTVGTLGQLTGLTSANLDPLSRVGAGPKLSVNGTLTKADPTAGLGTIIRLFANSGKYVDQVAKGDITRSQAEAKIAGEVQYFARNQLSPGYAAMLSAATGKDWRGQSVSASQQFRNLLTDSAPIAARSIYDGLQGQSGVPLNPTSLQNAALHGNLKGGLASLPSLGALSVETGDLRAPAGSNSVDQAKFNAGMSAQGRSITDSNRAGPFYAAQDEVFNQFKQKEPGLASASDLNSFRDSFVKSLEAKGMLSQDAEAQLRKVEDGMGLTTALRTEELKAIAADPGIVDALQHLHDTGHKQYAPPKSFYDFVAELKARQGTQP